MDHLPSRVPNHMASQQLALSLSYWMTKITVSVVSKEGGDGGKEQSLPPPVTASGPRYRPKVSHRCQDCCLGAAIATIICVVISGAIICGFVVVWNKNAPSEGQGNATVVPEVSFEFHPKDYVNKAPFTFDDIYDSSLRPRGFDGRWISGNELTTRKNGSLMIFNVETEEYSVLVPEDKMVSGTYWLSPDRRYVLFASSIVSIWRYSYLAQYSIFDTQVPNGPIIEFPQGEMAGNVQQYARWTASGSSLTFVSGNNLYYQASPSTDPVQISTSGELGNIFNGIPDWLYEEDVLGSPVCHYTSPDSRYVVYAEIDATEVSKMSWPWYGPQTDVYGKTVNIAYPKPGDVRNGEAGPNTKVTLNVWDSNNPEAGIRQIAPPQDLADQDHYLTRVAFKDAQYAFVVWTNRVQNIGRVMLCDLSASGECQLHMEEDVPNGWIDAPYRNPNFIDDGARYLSILPQNQGLLAGNWNQLVVITAEFGEVGSVTALTSGQSEVTSVAAYDSDDGMVYYIGTNGDSTERHLFKVPIDESEPASCLTCDESDECRYVSASFSPSREYYIQTCSGPDIPSYRIRQTNGEKDLMMEDNADVRERLATKDLGRKEYITIPIGGGYEGRAEVTYPPFFSTEQKYPVIVDVYAGPGAQKVTKRFNLGGTGSNWYEFMRSSVGAIQVAIDARGSAYRGENFMFEINRRLCTVEVADQIALAQYFKDQSYVDENLPIASFGWSYGGLVSSHLVSDPSGAVQCGIAVAPVTNFKYYDTAYTERYMGLATPADNEAAYNATDVMSRVENIRGRHYMLGHGTADDNVHFQQAAQLVRALNEADISYRTSMFIDQNHGIGEYRQNRHLYSAMTDFIREDCGWPIPEQ